MVWFHLLVAGAWGSVWHWGLGIGIIILCLLCAFGTTLVAGLPGGPWLVKVLGPLRHDFIIAAALVALFLAGLYTGHADEKKQCVAKTVVITNVVEKVVKETTPIPRPDGKAPRDRWDNPEN